MGSFSDLWNEVKGYAEHAIAVLEADAKAELMKVIGSEETVVADTLSGFKNIAVDTAISMGTSAMSSLAHGEKVSIVKTEVLKAAAEQGLELAEHEAELLAQHALSAVGLAVQNQKANPAE